LTIAWRGAAGAIGQAAGRLEGSPGQTGQQLMAAEQSDVGGNGEHPPNRLTGRLIIQPRQSLHRLAVFAIPQRT